MERRTLDRRTLDRRTFVSYGCRRRGRSTLPAATAAQPAPKARNIVLVHGLFADGSCWSEVIARLQPKGLMSLRCRTR